MTRSDQRICLLGAVGVVTFIVYGSLQPFDFTRPDHGWLAQVRFIPWRLVSRTDVLTNIMGCVPLGFSLMGLRSERRGRVGATLLSALLVVSATAALATTVELLQVLSGSRESSWNDVVAQTLGGSVGVLTWTAVGTRSIEWLRRLADERDSSKFVAGILKFYIPSYVFMQLSSADATVQLAELSNMYREGQITVVPFAEQFALTLDVLRDLVGSMLLNVPLGALTVLGWVQKGTRRRVMSAFLLAMAVVISAEAAQGLIWSRQASVTDILTGAVGVAIGTAAAVRWAQLRRRDSGWSHLVHTRVLVAAAVWTFMLVVDYWYPFDFETTDFAKERLTSIPWVLFTAYFAYSTDPLQGLREALRMCLLGVPLGVPAAIRCRARRDGSLATCRSDDQHRNRGAARDRDRADFSADGIPRPGRRTAGGDRRRNRLRDSRRARRERAHYGQRRVRQSQSAIMSPRGRSDTGGACAGRRPSEALQPTEAIPLHGNPTTRFRRW